MIESHCTIRIGRPSLDLDAAERFYVGGLGLAVLYRATGRPEAGERDLLMVGPEGAAWHLELTASEHDVVVPAPTSEDLLVVYLGKPVSETFVARVIEHGGTVVPSHNPYWDRQGVTLADPDGYRVVLTERRWSS
ncbi:VOC family protein [Streptomyces bohaiensis]|uniref:VOC family protein n=1 Tax=Streptomyces bohaiensis TaxID=1431344 RepID=UPI003B7CD9F8